MQMLTASVAHPQAQERGEGTWMGGGGGALGAGRLGAGVAACTLEALVAEGWGKGSCAWLRVVSAG
jgi:hypothetical protein